MTLGEEQMNLELKQKIENQKRRQQKTPNKKTNKKNPKIDKPLGQRHTYQYLHHGGYRRGR